jgi:hypothetical protein
LGLSVLLAQGCGGSPAATPIVVVATTAPTSAAATSAPAATSTTTPPATTAAATQAPAAAATATPAAAASGEGLRSSTPAPAATATAAPPTATPAPVASGGNEGLKPAAPSSGKPAATQAAQHKNRYLIEALSKVEPTPTPAPTRKGVADPNVDSDQYATEVATDLVAMAESLGRIQTMLEGIEQETISDEEVVRGVEQEAKILNDIYARQIARDYPPELKPIDDLFAESTRYASRMMNSFVELLRTGDEQHLTEVEQHAEKFLFFFNELMAKLQ